MLAQLEQPIRLAIRAALGISSESQCLYATDLLHMDAGIRSLRSDNEAAHLRLFHKVLASSDTSIQHRVFKSLPDYHLLAATSGVQCTVGSH
jgi:hypothetical protein